MDPESLKGNPLLIDKLNGELGGKVVKWVQDDMDRARRQAEEKDRRKKEKGEKKGR
jgi:hypothetical protein